MIRLDISKILSSKGVLRGLLIYFEGRVFVVLGVQCIAIKLEAHEIEMGMEIVCSYTVIVMVPSAYKMII